MLKIRYYRLRLPSGFEFNSLESAVFKIASTGALFVSRASKDEIVVRYTTTRQIETIQILFDGSEIKSLIPTMSQYSLRFFQSKNNVILSLTDPPRGIRITSEVLSLIFDNKDYFIEPLEITTTLIRRHINSFDSARLVSAKIRDFKVYDNAIGRLEITSKDGLADEIAPFLTEKYYKIDLLTYEITHEFQRGLISYFSNGTIRASGPLTEIAFPAFESKL